ncbi:MAG: hypothetical protein N3E47_03080 [Candidatus Bathyarchaeota archaeon]|nr:hypothetical protein [Candidatus Bathyarchaeota archaeon]
MKIYEYIFAATVIVAILIAAIFLTGISPTLYGSTSRMEQLKIAAQKIMAQILLSPGDPSDWGENIAVKAESLSSFGLAVSSVFTRDAFVLDPDKVQRLSQDVSAQLYMPPSRVLELLNLDSDYGIKIEFIPALNISVSLEGKSATIKILSEQGAPASYVSVVAGAFHVQDGKIGFNVARLTDEDGDGICKVGFPFSPHLLIVIADHNGVQMAHVYSSNAYTGQLIGRFLLSPIKITGGSSLQVFAVRLPNGSLTLRNVVCNLKPWGYPVGNYNLYNVSHVEPNVIAVVTLNEDNNLIVAYKTVPKSYGSLAGEVYPPLAYMLERSVKIGLFTYTLRLRVWRMIE